MWKVKSAGKINNKIFLQSFSPKLDNINLEVFKNNYLSPYNNKKRTYAQEELYNKENKFF